MEINLAYWIPIISITIAVLTFIGGIIWALIKFRDKVNSKADKNDVTEKLHQIALTLERLGVKIESTSDRLEKGLQEIKDKVEQAKPQKICCKQK
jgi:hypothetical protein